MMSRFLICILLALHAFRLEAGDALPVFTPATTAPTANEQVEVALFTGVAIADNDDTQLTRLTVTITNPRDGDDLNYSSLPSTITVETNEKTLLVFVNSVPKATYQTLLQTITFTAGSDQPGITRTITAIVRDGNNDSLPVTATVAITPQNDSPVLNANTVTQTVNEQQAVTVFPDATIGDPDSVNMTHLEIVITGPRTGDALATNFAVPVGMTLNAPPNATTITASGLALASAYQSLLQSITFMASTDTPIGPRVITATVTDKSATDNNNAVSTGRTSTITITDVNDKPVITPAVTTPVPRGNEGTAIPLFPAAGISDDGQQLNLMKVLITDKQDGDLLAWTNVTGLTVKVESNGDLTIEPTPTAPAAPLNSFRDLLRSVTLQANNDNPRSSREVKATVRDTRDGTNTSEPTIANVTIDNVNDPPTIPSAPLPKFQIDEDQVLTLTFDQLAIDARDPDGPSPSLQIASVVNGTLEILASPSWTPVNPGTTVLASGQSLRWTPGLNVVDEVGATAFTISAWDGLAPSIHARHVQIIVKHRVDISGISAGLAYNLDSGRLRLATEGTMMAINELDRPPVMRIAQSRLVATLTGVSAEEDILSLSSNAGAGLILVTGSKIQRVAVGAISAVEVASYQLDTHKVTITFNGSATYNDVEKASRLLVYDNVFGDNGSLAQRTVKLVFEEEGRQNSNTLTQVIQMLAVNRPPEIILGIENDIFTVQPNSSAAITVVNLRARDRDAVPTPPADLIFRLISTPAYGTLRVVRVGVVSPLSLNGEFTQAEIEAGLVTYLHRGGSIPTDSAGLQVRERGANGLISNAVTFLINIGVAKGAAIISDPVFIAIKKQESTHTISFVGDIGKLQSVDILNKPLLSTIAPAVDGVSVVWKFTFPDTGYFDVTVVATFSGQIIRQQMQIRVVDSLTPKAGG